MIAKVMYNKRYELKFTSNELRTFIIYNQYKKAY